MGARGCSDTRDTRLHGADPPYALTQSCPPPALSTHPARSMSVVRTYCGHGIGDLFHCAPNVPHYAKNKAKGTMKVGVDVAAGGHCGAAAAAAVDGRCGSPPCFQTHPPTAALLHRWARCSR